MEDTAAVHIRTYVDTDFNVVVALWNACGLLRPWNDPVRDIALSRATPTSEIFLGFQGKNGASGSLGAAIMTGSDGHRGWLYYLAVDPAQRGTGLGRAMVRHAETWLADRGVWKVELMIRDDNADVRSFYQKIGYQTEPRVVMARWLEDEHGRG